MADYKEGSIFTPVGTRAFQPAGPAIKRYSTTPEVVEAALVTENNLEELARWCGGGVSDEQTHDEGIIKHVLVPSIYTPSKARVGYYIVKYIDTGRFSSMTEGEFSSRGFHEVGLRQDGPQIKTAGTITRNPGPIAINSGEAYGEYADQRYWQGHDASDMS